MRSAWIVGGALGCCVGVAALAAVPAPWAGAQDRAEEPGSRAARHVVDTLEDVERRLVTTRYQARTDVDLAAGRFRWDCSGMVGWVLRRAAPRAFASLGRPRPVAADFHRVASHAPTGRYRGGWRRIGDIADARPGDIAAWRTPRRFGATGHVVVLLETPLPSALHPRRWVARIADSTRIPHWADSRRDPDGGYGTGIMSFEVDDRGRAVAWGWLGPAAIHFSGDVAVGRVGG